MLQAPRLTGALAVLEAFGRRRWVEPVVSNASLAADYVKQHGRKAADAMTHNVITVSPTTDVADIAHVLETNHIKRVPVMEAGKLVGIVSCANIVQALASSGPGGLSAGSPAGICRLRAGAARDTGRGPRTPQGYAAWRIIWRRYRWSL
jgi:CBS-domain-containing membrane protein